MGRAEERAIMVVHQMQVGPVRVQQVQEAKAAAANLKSCGAKSPKG